ncbi:hypothetical protein AMTRI_Chr08g206040 [Amborella trichopoda]
MEETIHLITDQPITLHYIPQKQSSILIHQERRSILRKALRENFPPSWLHHASSHIFYICALHSLSSLILLPHEYIVCLHIMNLIYTNPITTHIQTKKWKPNPTRTPNHVRKPNLNRTPTPIKIP